ncbi:MAG: sigma factor G inhibitor Gin [Firmicutes bacterium]|nr:sigma factor G inhibitor Gin [Bacillota bacterium]MDD4264243.1 sigma factor G inhibitor Gin [Bacillota bacterium]MDD4694196.1 sigma factor G inhibitor Gin [Bacillota bacterium]
MAKCLICKRKIESLVAIGEQCICRSCEKQIIGMKPKDKGYEELLLQLKPLSKMILSSYEKIEDREEREFEE